VAVETSEGVVYVARVPDGPIVVLRDVAALIWEEAQIPDSRSIADRIAERTERAVDEVKDDVAAFLSALVDGGLLVRAG
jgi:hypothetical protein